MILQPLTYNRSSRLRRARVAPAKNIRVAHAAPRWQVRGGRGEMDEEGTCANLHIPLDMFYGERSFHSSYIGICVLWEYVVSSR